MEYVMEYHVMVYNIPNYWICFTTSRLYVKEKSQTFYWTLGLPANGHS